MADTQNPFVKLAAIDVSQHIEKKQNLSYLSWAWAVDQLMRADPAANWQFHEPTKFGDSMMVSCTVTAFGKPVTMHLPVMDHRNQAVKNPDAFVVNKNMMRCLVKAIACHGLGLYIYAGEDLPADEEGNPAQQAPKQQAPAKQAAPKPPVAGPGLSEESMEAVTVAMVEADDIASLQKTFGDAYKKANAAQQVALKKTYDEVKTILTTGATA
jgi:hypothetical protein